MSLEADVRQHVSTSTGLSDTEVHALEHLARQPIGPAEIARLLDVSTAASTGIVDRLEAKGHVERRPHSRDRRRTEVVITDSARSEVLQHMGGMFRALAQLDASLSPDEREVVVRYLRGAVAAAEAAGPLVETVP
ncbi:MarR family transcriptional regulator [Serinibacter arcticus]|uniref:MarR family transcriptional regulator n=2 Tax=Serinibacter arcticus TaxID=1655435 RepID=A0A2U1ZZ53_9MICO|nr:MarR family transcriptional regulator [Serinibacter arcticus]